MKVAVYETSMRPLRGQWLATMLGVVILIAGAHHAQADSTTHDPRVIPPQAHFRGLSYGEWGAEWWKALLSVPVADDGSHPYFDGGTFGWVKDVLYIIGPFGVSTMDLTISAGTPILLAVINAECSILEPAPYHGDNESELSACANEHIDTTSGVFAEIDGVAVKNLNAYRSQSPLFEFGPLPEGNLLAYFGLDAPAGTTSLSVDAGIYLLLTPLSVGSHMIHVGGTYEDLGSFDTTFNITVAPNKH